MGRYGDIDYPTVTRRGFALGVALLVVGTLGHVLGPLLFGPLPEWERTLFLDMEILGVLLGLLTPLVFGIVLPLTE
jgi:energy-converting hydrogenase Eha subunit E